MPNDPAGNESRASEGGAGAPPRPDDRNKAPDLTREYDAPEITVQWYASRCIHSANCVRALRAVFDPQRRPWVDPTAASADAIAAAVLRCPTGALHFMRHDGGAQEEPDVPTTLTPSGMDRSTCVVTSRCADWMAARSAGTRGSRYVDAAWRSGCPSATTPAARRIGGTRRRATRASAAAGRSRHRRARMADRHCARQSAAAASLPHRTSAISSCPRSAFRYCAAPCSPCSAVRPPLVARRPRRRSSRSRWTISRPRPAPAG